MKKIVFAAMLLLPTVFSKAQNNTLLDSGFWRKNPSLENVKAEIKNGNSPSQQNAGFFDPVSFAIINKTSNDVVKFMIDQEGNSIHKKTHHSRTYLQWAAAAGNLELVQYLISKGSDIQYKDSHGSSVIAYAAEAGNKNIEVFETLVKAGANPLAKSENGSTLMMLSIAGDDDLKLVDYFTKKGLSIKDKDQYGRTVADYAARFGNLEIVNQLIAKGVKPTDQALFFADQGSRAKQNGLEVYQSLVDKYKLNPKAVNPNGATILHSLVRRPNTEIITYFLDKGVDVSKADKEGNTALMLAVQGNDQKLVETLLSKSKNVNAANEKGETALMNAFANGSSDVAAILLKNGANAKAIDKNGNNLVYYWFNSFKPTPAGKAGETPKDDFSEKLSLLKTAGLDIKAAQKNGSTLLHIAADKGDLALMRKALEFDIDINAKDADGNTALHKVALTAKDDKILQLLVKAGAKKDISTEFGETAYDLAKENQFLVENKVAIDFLK